MTRKTRSSALTALVAAVAVVALGFASAAAMEIGREVSIPTHLEDGEEYEVPVSTLLAHGRALFEAMWTDQEGGGRPLSKGTGAALADPDDPLTFPRNFNRISAPDANSCAGCHNVPRVGGGGDIVANVFVLGQRFDSVSFDPNDVLPGKGAFDEQGRPLTLGATSNSRATLGMFGSGYIEMLAREITFDLRAQAEALGAGQSVALTSKGISFGTLRRGVDGSWDASGVEGLPPGSSRSGAQMPSLIIKPFHQAGAVISLREFSNNAFNHHHGIQTTERVGLDSDPDGDGFLNEMTRADVTAVTVWQATLPAPGRVIPRNRELERAILLGEEKFAAIGCANCHIPALPLSQDGEWFYEPNPFNPAGNARPGDMPLFKIDLNVGSLPGPRLSDDRQGVTWVPAFTDFKLHDITSGPDDPNRETLDMHFPAGTEDFFAGNGKFLTKKLWGIANEAPFYHHGKYVTMRESILAHAGEAEDAAAGFRALSDFEQGSIIEFLKTLQVLPEGTKHLVVDENGNPRSWPPPWAR